MAIWLKDDCAEEKDAFALFLMVLTVLSQNACQRNCRTGAVDNDIHSSASGWVSRHFPQPL